MKALTLWQPWASLIALGVKPFEFRGWKPPAKAVGTRIAVHAASRRARRIEIAWLVSELERGENGRVALHREALELLRGTGPGDWPLSCIVCTAVLGEPLGGLEAARSMGAEINDSDREGTFNWAWPMNDIVAVPSLPCRGAYGLWPVPADLAREIGELAAGRGPS